MHISVATAPRTVISETLHVPKGTTVQQALQQCKLPVVQSWQEQGANPEQWQHSVWGRRAALNQALRDNDRIELVRQLLVDPKVARRERFASQGSKMAGLFARRRTGAKPGY